MQTQPELIVLIGFMGAGKSTIGRALARRLGWAFVDLDRWIEKRERRRIAEIFATDGEPNFRALEAKALAAVLEERSGPSVLALGGGAWVQAGNAARLKTAGARVVFLDATVDELRERCRGKASKRPLFQDEEQFAQLYAKRRDKYMQADLRVETTGRSVPDVAAELAQIFQVGVSYES